MVLSGQLMLAMAGLTRRTNQSKAHVPVLGNEYPASWDTPEVPEPESEFQDVVDDVPRGMDEDEEDVSIFARVADWFTGER